MKPRFEFGGDEYLLVLIDEDMSLEANLRTMAIAAAAERLEIPGVIEVCPGSASYLVHYDPDVVHGEDLIERLSEVQDLPLGDATVPSRLVRVPIWFDDPYTNEIKRKYADRHQEPEMSDLAYTARENGMDPAGLIEAYCAAPWWVAMVGFTPGTIFGFQMVAAESVIQAPKWPSPRPITYARTLSHGGAFTGIDPVDEPSGYQMLGRTPVPIFDPDRDLPGLDSPVLARAADRWSFYSVDGDEYRAIRDEVKARKYKYDVIEQEFSLELYRRSGADYVAELEGRGSYAVG
jgi:urea carboxylase